MTVTAEDIEEIMNQARKSEQLLFKSESAKDLQAKQKVQPIAQNSINSRVGQQVKTADTQQDNAALTQASRNTTKLVGTSQTTQTQAQAQSDRLQTNDKQTSDKSQIDSRFTVVPLQLQENKNSTNLISQSKSEGSDNSRSVGLSNTELAMIKNMSALLEQTICIKCGSGCQSMITAVEVRCQNCLSLFSKNSTVDLREDKNRLIKLIIEQRGRVDELNGEIAQLSDAVSSALEQLSDIRKRFSAVISTVDTIIEIVKGIAVVPTTATKQFKGILSCENSQERASRYAGQARRADKLG